MRSTSRILLDKLIELTESRRELTDDDLDELKARFMMITSSSPETLDELERLTYRPSFADEARPEDGERSGVTLAQSGLLLSAFVVELMALSREAVKELLCSYEEYQAGLTALWAIVQTLEWSSFDSAHPPEWTPDKVQSYLAAYMRSLRNYRQTGEP